MPPSNPPSALPPGLSEEGDEEAAARIRSLVERYARAWQEDDREGWLATFASDATQEDPVGEGVRVGRQQIGEFWDGAMASYERLRIEVRAIHVTGGEAALEWTIVAATTAEEVVFDGVDVFAFTPGDDPLIASVRAFWQRSGRATRAIPGD